VYARAGTMLGATAPMTGVMPLSRTWRGTCHGHSPGRRRPGLPLARAASPAADQTIPCASVITWCLEPVRARSTGLGPFWAALQRAHVRTVDHRLGPVQRPGAVQLGQRQLVQLLPHAPPRASPAASANRSSRTRTPAPAARPPTGFPVQYEQRCPTRPCGPGWSARLGTTGSSSSMRSRNPSGTIHDGCWFFLPACSTSTWPPLFPRVILLAVPSPLRRA
jgi:hypothetical protein